jgi:nucleoside-triphosphatase
VNEPRVTNLFVTGRPGVGKTTLIERVLEELDVDAGGFVTKEIREGGKRVGFAIADLRGPTGTLAHVSLESPFRVGKYGVDRDDLERIGVPAIEAAVERSPLVIMDEIGRMELCSEAFQQAVVRALDSPKPVFGTIQDRSNAFLDGVRERDDVEVARLTEANRDGMTAVLAERLAALLEER